MKKRITIILSSALMLICIMLFCPITSKLNFSVKAHAASDENLYVTSNNRVFTKDVVIGDHFKITVYQKKRIKTKALKFKSTNSSVASIDSNGNITALNYGRSKIKIYKGHHLLCTLTVSVVSSIPRTLFIGDSRTVYMFNVKNIELCGVIKDGMYVYARGGAQFWYINEVIEKLDPGTYDTVVTWMGANDRGSFKNYKYCYNEITSMGKKLIVCTVGPVTDSLLDDIGIRVFNNGLMVKYNKELKKWAKRNSTPIIDLYGFIRKKKLRVDSSDGVHYLPKPNTKIWKYICTQFSKM